jgi:hypothetical protein
MSASPPSREEIARIAYEAWLSVGEGKPGWVSWEDLPLISPEDYAACLAIADRVLDRFNDAAVS